MAQEGIQKKMIELLAQNEEIISELYLHCARKNIAQYSFWSTLAQEELLHASWLRKLGADIESGKVRLDENRFRADTIEESIRSIEGHLAQFRQKPPSLKEAIAVAETIESTLAESEFFKVFATDDPLLQGLLRALAQACVEHRNRLLEMARKEGVS
ncbi:MAG: hypothetical protein ABH865_04435 [Candidatus Omnitrophota bacterium]|nr:hypothetical protein [Candidatus Omnitrophota bacterium]